MSRTTAARTTGSTQTAATAPSASTEPAWVSGRLPAWHEVLGRPARLFADGPGGVAVDPSTPLSGFTWAGHETRHLVGTARRPFTLARALTEALSGRVLALGHGAIADGVAEWGPTAHLAFDCERGPDVLATVTPVSLDGALSGLADVDAYVVGVGRSNRVLVTARQVSR